MRSLTSKRTFVVSFLALGIVAGGWGTALLGVCGPFTDTAADAFCPLILQVFYLGITTGTTPSTYDPAGAVNRTQMAVFLSRTVDGTLKRAANRTAVNRLFVPKTAIAVGLTTVGFNPFGVRFDGADLWVANTGVDSVSRVRASDARLLETWSGATMAYAVLVAMNRVFVTGGTTPGKLYGIDPSLPAGAVTLLASTLGGAPLGIAFDGEHIWTANAGGSVSEITPGASLPWTVTSLSVGLGGTSPFAIQYDGSSLWVADFGLGTLVKLDGSGAVLQTVTIGVNPRGIGFDGTNLWVTYGNGLNPPGAIAVVRASNGSIVQTVTSADLSGPYSAAFDGQRMLVANSFGSRVTLWKASDLTQLGALDMTPAGGVKDICSDGAGFWITFAGGKLGRF